MIRSTPENPYPQLSLAEAVASAPVDTSRLEATVARLPKAFALRVRLLAKSLHGAVAYREGATREKIAAFLARAGLEGAAIDQGISAFFAIAAFTKTPASQAADWPDGLYADCMDSALAFQAALARRTAEPARSALVFLVTALAQSFGVRDVKALVNVAADAPDLQTAVKNPAFCALMAGTGTEIASTAEMLLGWQFKKAQEGNSPLNLKVTVTRGNEPPVTKTMSITSDMIASVTPDEDSIQDFATTLEAMMPAGDRLLLGKSLVTVMAVWDQLTGAPEIAADACRSIGLDPLMISFEAGLMKFASRLGNELLTRAATAGLMLPAASNARTPEEIEATASEDAARLMAEMEKMSRREDLFSRGMLGELSTAVKILNAVDEKALPELVSAALAEEDARTLPLAMRRMAILGQAIVDNDPLYPPKK